LTTTTDYGPPPFLISSRRRQISWYTGKIFKEVTIMDTPKHTLESVKQFRKDVDALVQRLDNEFGSSRELSLVKTKLEEAKMWAGKELGNLGSELPAEFADKAE
jgi:hypothetical protein